jgi:predicted ATPase/DNA-binding SARP family transcriptional activator
MPQLSTYFLGPFRVARDDKSVTGFESDKMRALLAYLVVEADHAHRREALAALLWPDQAESAARQSLRQAIYVLRNALSPGDEPAMPLLVTRQTVQVNPAAGIRCDVRQFNELLAACKAHRHQPPQNPDSNYCTECIERLQKATELYGGDFLQGFVVNDSRDFEEWMLLEREACHREMMYALGRLADYYEDIGKHERSLHFALWQLKLEPWREEAHRQAMRLLSRTGQRTAALAQYEVCRQALAEELGIEPARETTALYERIRDSETEHQAEHPEHSLAGTAILPVASTPLIGREAEVTSVVEQLLREDVRLLTITGPGGVGKTRIAIQAASDLQEQFADGAYFVNLAPIGDPGLVADEIAGALGVKERPDRTEMESLISYLQGKRLLLLLDNFEQIAEAAPLIAQLVRSTSGVKALITSRIALGLRGTREFPVPPMSLPDRKHLPVLEHLTGYEAIHLFVERAAALKPGFEITEDNAPAIVEICHRLDGLPLAIELAAARIKVLSPQAMLARLESRLQLVAGKDRDVPARQQTLRNTIDWSYNLLNESERALFRRMAAFQGGRTLRAIQSVCSEAGATSSISNPSSVPPMNIDLLDDVESLISKSLLQQMEGHDEEPRFWMLETIHEYAREKLWEGGEAEALRRRHARYFVGLVEEAAPHLKQKDQARWLEQLEDEHDNIRVAFQWATEHGQAGDDEAAEIGLRLAIGLERFWEVRVHLREGLERTVGVLAIPHKLGTRPGGALRARALMVAGTLAHACGEYGVARSMHEESIELWRELGDISNLVEALYGLGNVYFSQGMFENARIYIEEGLHVEHELGERGSGAHYLGIVMYELGDFEAAGTLLEQELELQRENGDTRRVALALANLGLVAYEQGNYELALARDRESLAIRRTLGAKRGFVYSLEGLAMVYRALGRPELAARLWGAAQALRDTVGSPTPPNEQARYRREMDMLRAQLGDDGFERSYTRGRNMQVEQAVAEALDDARGPHA